jgi:hypothetical protein
MEVLMGDRTERRYSRTTFDHSARMLLSGWSWKQIRQTDVTIYELGPAGCGLISKDGEFQYGQSVYLEIPGGIGAFPLNICARIVWKHLENDQCRYGLEFLWVRKLAAEEIEDKVTNQLNEALKGTGYTLLPTG